MADLTIIGAGPAGTIAAIKAARAGADVVVLDRSSFTRQRPGEHLSAKGAIALSKLGWRAADHSEIVQPITSICSSWGPGAPVTQPRMFRPEGLGYAVARPAFERSLHDWARKEGVRLRLQTRVIKLEAHGHLWVTSGGRKEQIAASRILDASGASRFSARRQGDVNLDVDPLICCHFNAPVTTDKRDELFQVILESGASGWWFSLGHPDRRRYTVSYFTDPQSLKARGAGLEEFLHEALESAPLTKRRVTSKITGLRCFATGTKTPRSTKGQGRIRIGDAAARLDPLSGLGLERAIAGASSIEAETYSEVRDHFYALAREKHPNRFWQRHGRDGKTRAAH